MVGLRRRKTESLATALRKRVIKAYTTPSVPGSFTNASKLTRHNFAGKNKKIIQKALQTLDAYTLHKPARRIFTRNRVVVGSIDQQWQIDLMDMQKLAKENKGYKYILTVIDVFSKYAWAIPTKSKSGNDVTKAFQDILENSKRKPQYVQSDKGKEFLNTTFQKFLKNEGIGFFTSENDEIKAGIVERLNRTVKEKLWRYFTHTGRYGYIDAVLQKLIHSYNNTQHTSLNMTPAQVGSENQEAVFYNLYEPSKKQIKSICSKTQSRKTVERGDRVRIVKTRGAFAKGYEPNWTSEVFTIVKNKGKRGYIIVDDSGEEIKGVFYPEEVQKVLKPLTDTYQIEKVLRYRGKGKAKEAFVHWKGYSHKFDQWIPFKDITNL